MDVEFFHDLENEFRVFACRGLYAYDGLFMADLKEPEPAWETLVPDSPRWDNFHQMIFLAHRVQGLDPAKLPPSLQAVPPKPVGPFPSAESYLAPDSPIPASAYPHAAAQLADDSLTIRVLLHEDLYEKQFGDGRFHYLHSVHLSEGNARAAVAKLADEWNDYHLRAVTIRLHDGVFDFPNFEVKLFDHHKQTEVLAALENLLDPTPPESKEVTMATLEAAITLAAEAHKGQTDKAGSPYILHPLRVMFAVTTDDERMAAVMHDVVEDTPFSLDDLRDAGFPEAVVSAVEALSRREGESYDDFVRRAAGNTVARAVKLADIEDNMDVRRLDTVDEKAVSRMKRYHDAWKILTSES